MKLIQAMKALKDLLSKAEDLRKKVAEHCAAPSTDTPKYPDQRGKIGEWLQAHHDTLKEVQRLRLAIQRTNLATPVTIELAGRPVTHSIAGWIHRRRDLSKLEHAMWSGLGDRGLKEGQVQLQANSQPVQISIVRYFDIEMRDRKVEEFRTESSVIDAALEVTNAVTELIESSDG